MILTILGSIAGAVVGLLALAAGMVGILTYVRREFPRENTDRLHHEERITSLELKVEGLPSLWEAEKKTAKRAADAAKKARKDASEKLEEIEEIVASNGELPGEYAAAGAEAEMHPVRTNMGMAPASDLAERAAGVEWLMRR